MAVIETWFNQDLQQPVKVHYLDGSMFSHNGNGNRIGVHVFNNGEPVTLSGTVSGYVVTADGSTVPCTGSRSGNSASIVIPAAAYQPGAVFITIFLTDGSTVTTLASVATNVLTARTGNQVSPGSVVTDWTNTINAAMQSVVDANAANMAIAYADLVFPVPLGAYCIHDNYLYRCTTPIATSEEWTSGHWTRVKIADEVADVKFTISGTEGTNNIYTNIKKYFGQYCRVLEGVPLVSGHKYKIYCKTDKAVGVDGDLFVESAGYVSVTSAQLLAGYEWDYTSPVTGSKYIQFHSNGQGDTSAKIFAYVEDLTLNRSYTDGLVDSLAARTDRRFKESLVFMPVNYAPFAGCYNTYLKDYFLNNNYRSVLIKNYGVAAVKVDSISQSNCPPVVFFSGIPSPSTYMGYYGNASTSVTYKDEIVLIPDGVEYIAINGLNSSTTPLKVEIAANKELVAGDLYEYTIQTGGGYSAVTKEWYANSSYKATLIPCNEGDIFVITTVTNGSNHLALAYSGEPSASTYIMDFYSNGNNLTYYENAIVVAPKGCTKMAINGYLSNDLVVKDDAYQFFRYGDDSENEVVGFEAKVANGVLTVKPNRAYNGDMISVVMKRRGGNNFFDFDSIVAIGENSNTTIEENVTDWIMPYKIQAMIDDPGGDNQGSYYFTGGNHRSTNSATGGVVTGVCDYLKYFVDGVETSDFNGLCNEVRVEWQNRVTAFNTTREDGNGLLVLQCNHILTISNGEFKVRTILTPIKKVKMLAYYGYGMHGSGNDCYARYVGSQENRNKTAIGTSSNSGGKTTKTLSIEKGVYHMDLTLDRTLDMGRGNYAANQDVDSFVSSNKMYWWVVGSELVMEEGEKFYIDATYKFY